MKIKKIKKYLRLVNRPKVVLLKKEDGFEFLNFNGAVDCEVHEEKIETLLSSSLDEYFFEMEANASKDSLPFDKIDSLIENILSRFHVSGDYLSYKKILIRDVRNKNIDYNILPDELKHQISLLLNINKNSLNFLIKEISEKCQEIKSNYRCNIKKKDFIVFSSALFYSNFIDSVNGKLSRDQFIIDFGKFLGIEIKEPRKVLNQIINPDKSTQIFDTLKKNFSIKFDDEI